MKTTQSHLPPFTPLLELYNKAYLYSPQYIEKQILMRWNYFHFKNNSQVKKIKTILTPFFLLSSLVLVIAAFIAAADPFIETVAPYVKNILILCGTCVITYGTVYIYYNILLHKLCKRVQWYNVNDVLEFCDIFEMLYYYEHATPVPNTAEGIETMIVADAKSIVSKIKSYPETGAVFLEANALAPHRARLRSVIDLILKLGLMGEKPINKKTFPLVYDRKKILAERSYLLYQKLYDEVS